MKYLIFIFTILGCSKQPEITIKGYWIAGETVYNFESELIITNDGESENYVYYISNDTVYLDYGLPFKIELLTESNLALSKNDGSNYYLYTFNRISDYVLRLGVRFLAYRIFQVTTKLNSQKLTLR